MTLHSSTRPHSIMSWTPLVAGVLLMIIGAQDAYAQAPQVRPEPDTHDVLVIVPRLDLNEASRDELLALPGIGPARADAILARRQRRLFRRPRDLVRVRGIGPAIFRRLREHVWVSRVGRTARRR